MPSASAGSPHTCAFPRSRAARRRNNISRVAVTATREKLSVEEFDVVPVPMSADTRPVYFFSRPKKSALGAGPEYPPISLHGLFVRAQIETGQL
jgi:hypothetical protein